MAYIACAECGVQTYACCGSGSRCPDCKSKASQALREKVEKEAIERQSKIASGEIVVTPVNIADLNPQFCRCCGIPKTWCKCECKGQV